MIAHSWHPIAPLSEEDRAIDLALQPLYGAWYVSQARLRESSAASLQAFNERLIRRLSVETGILERLYDVDRGTTEILVERGFVEDLVTRSSTDTEPARLIQVLKDHENAFSLLMDCVNGQRELTIGFIHELHTALTLHQDTVTAHDQFGVIHEIPLRRGVYKEWPNNPTRTDGLIHEFCPPLQVAPEMDRLLGMYAEYAEYDPVLTAAWLHHRFAQIHPYQDGNGRVARALVTLVLLKAGIPPIVVDRDARVQYLGSLETADAGNLEPLAYFFAEQERNVILQALSVEADEDAGKRPTVTSIVIADVADKLRKRQQQKTEELSQVNSVAVSLRANAQEVIRNAFGDLQQSIMDILANLQTDYFVDTGGPDEGNAHWYRQDVIRTAKESNTYVNFNEPHYFIKGSFRAGHERLVFVVSFHHIGRELSGVMEATAFALFESFETAEDTQSRDRDFSLCSMSPFVFAYKTHAEDVARSFEEWLDHALAPAIKDWSNRL